ncbi:MAG: rhodanese-like domain-containing protein [Myxococcota bacterium]|nr:rhodanese-like domain-containing protein [Myxococcota bacterium]
MQRLWCALAIGLLGCGGSIPATGHDPLPESHRVSGEQAMRLVISGALLVDVSPHMEYAGRHLEGAINIPITELQDRLHELPRDRPIVVYSRDGEDAPQADLVLRAAGFDVHVLGAFDRWHARGA